MSGDRGALGLAVLAGLLCAGSLSGAAFLSLGFDEVFQKAHEVFVGKVRRAECLWDAEGKMIWTHRSLFSRQSRLLVNNRLSESLVTATAAYMVLACRHLPRTSRLCCATNWCRR